MKSFSLAHSCTIVGGKFSIKWQINLGINDTITFILREPPILNLRMKISDDCVRVTKTSDRNRKSFG